MPKKAVQPRPESGLGFAMIAKDAEQTIGRCLDSIQPLAQQIVVCVDERTTDKTARIAKRYGAEVHSVKVSDWHECAMHGRVLAQHFARARNESFSHLDPALKWWAWIDSDDILKGGEHLLDILGSLPDDMVGLWAPYHYSTMQSGAATNTLFHRERFFRSAVGWKWEYRVHEVATPSRPGPWVLANEVAMYHQEGAHKTESSALRNLLLLEIDYEEDPTASRTLFYLGNQYFAMGEWGSAIAWYERLGRLTEQGHYVNPYELWQSRCYQAMAFQKMGDFQMAQQACFAAIDSMPGHPEPYYILASVYTLMGQPDKAVYWTKHGREQPEPPFFVFKNPLDYTFNNRLQMSDALAQMGKVAEAREELEQAHAALSDPNVQSAIEHYRKIESETEEAKAFKQWAAYMPDGILRDGLVVARYSDLSREVKGISSVRDIAVPIIMRNRPNTQPSIIFAARVAWEEWGPPKLNETGLGGSETAVVEIARRFAADGWRVDVYNQAGPFEGTHDGVGYWDARRYQGDAPDIFVSWREPGLKPPDGSHGILWCHDLNYGPIGSHMRPEGMRAYERVLGVSAWHSKMLRNYYDLPEELVSFVPNGVDLSRFSDSVRKVPFRCVYASSPDRGLLQLLHLWPKISAGESGAELHIAYGFATIDKMIESGRPGMAEFKQAVLDKIAETPQVVNRGRLPQDELATLYSESWLWLYPTNFLEVSCISAMEAMAAGAVPVTSAAGALKETIDTAGVVLPGQPHSFPWQDCYVLSAKAVLTDASIRKPLEYAGKSRAQELTWDKAYEHWVAHTSSLLEGSKELVTA